MLGAYSEWYAAQPLPKPAALDIVEHYSHPYVFVAGRLLAPQKVPTPGTREIPCTEPGCVRCNEAKGGFQFRWFSTD